MLCIVEHDVLQAFVPRIAGPKKLAHLTHTCGVDATDLVEHERAKRLDGVKVSGSESTRRHFRANVLQFSQLQRDQGRARAEHRVAAVPRDVIGSDENALAKFLHGRHDQRERAPQAGDDVICSRADEEVDMTQDPDERRVELRHGLQHQHLLR